MKPLTRILSRLCPARTGHKPVRRHSFLPALELLEDRQVPTVFAVTNTADSGAGSLRQAILDANSKANVDTNGDGLADPDRITFNLSGTGVHTFTPGATTGVATGLGELPAIKDPVLIDGYSQPGAAWATATSLATLKIVLDGSSAGPNGRGLVILARASMVQGLVIHSFDGDAITIQGSAASRNVVQGNYIGTDVAGTAARGNSRGVFIEDAPNNTIGGTAPGDRNVISGNQNGGVLISERTASGNVVQGNYIGTDVTGSTDLGNGGFGVLIRSAPNNTIGGTAPGARNLISGNFMDGVGISDSRASGNFVQGNYIGTDATGTAALRNRRHGVYLAGAPNNTVGGTAAGARNLISGNGSDGVRISSSLASGNSVQGNSIGTNAAGTAVLGNHDAGVLISGAPNSTVGGMVSGARNLISGNGSDGVGILGSRASGNVVQGNHIGTNAAGTDALGNHRHGVYLAGAPNNTVGGTAAGACNLISGNGSDGISIEGSGASGNLVQGNSIGTDATGAFALGNGINGVAITDASNTTVGGTAAGARNLISGNNDSGVRIEGNGASGNVVQSNSIGTNAAGTAGLGNGDSGVVLAGASNNAIGGTIPGAGNLIAFNGMDGVTVKSGTGNAILSNRIYANARLGIDVWNNAQQFPGLSVAVNGNSNFLIQGTLTSTANTSFRLEFFASAVADPSGNGEGERFLGSRIVTTDADGVVRDANGNPGFTVALPVTVAVGQVVSATATRLETPLVPRETSEFSLAVAVPGSIAGRTFHDLNANGVRDSDEPGLPNWTIYLDANRDGQWNAGETIALTDAAGDYVFVNPPVGINDVRAVVQFGWVQSTPGAAAGWGHKLTLAAGQVVTDRDFGNYRLGSIAGRKFHDLNADGVLGAVEPGLPGWVIYLDANNNGQLDKGETSIATDANGFYQFPQLRPGTYRVREVLQTGWQQSGPAAGGHTVVLTSGHATSGQDFGTYRLGTIAGLVFHDYDTDGVRDSNEPGMPNWPVYLDANYNGRLDAGEASRLTDATGLYTFDDLRPGNYMVREEVYPSWRQTAPAAGAHTLTLTSGQADTNRNFGNTPHDPMLILILSRTQVSEGAGPGAVTATVIRSGAPTTAALIVALSSSDTTEARVPATVTIPAGQSSATFLIDAIDDLFADGPRVVQVGAYATGFATGFALLVVTDDEP